MRPRSRRKPLHRFRNTVTTCPQTTRKPAAATEPPPDEPRDCPRPRRPCLPGDFGPGASRQGTGDPGVHVRTRQDLHGAYRIGNHRSEEHTSELQSLMRISYAVFCLKKKKTNKTESHSNKL